MPLSSFIQLIQNVRRLLYIVEDIQFQGLGTVLYMTYFGMHGELRQAVVFTYQMELTIANGRVLMDKKDKW
jgi:hypothetical protein